MNVRLQGCNRSRSLQNQQINYSSQQDIMSLKILYGSQLLELQICSNWTISKLKCLLVYLFATLKFEQFQLLSGNYLLTHNSQVKDISTDFITITKAECKGSFDQYYSQNIRKILNQYNINVSSSNYSTLHPCYLKPLIRQINMDRIQNFQPYIRANNPQRQNNQGFGVFAILRIIGSLALLNIISSLANYFQIFIIILVALSYIWIDIWILHNVRQNNRRRAQRANNQRQNFQPQQLVQPIQKVQQKNQEKQSFKQKGQQNQQNQKQKGQKQQKEPIQQEQIDTQKKRNQSNNQNEKNQQKHQIQYKLQKFSQYNKSQNQNQSQKGQNEPTEQQEQQLEQIKAQKGSSGLAKMVLLSAFVCQIIYCYILSLFPNWTVETHILANQQKMNRVIQYVHKLDPSYKNDIDLKKQ